MCCYKCIYAYSMYRVVSFIGVGRFGLEMRLVPCARLDLDRVWVYSVNARFFEKSFFLLLFLLGVEERRIKEYGLLIRECVHIPTMYPCVLFIIH